MLQIKKKKELKIKGIADENIKENKERIATAGEDVLMDDVKGDIAEVETRESRMEIMVPLHDNDINSYENFVDNYNYKYYPCSQCDYTTNNSGSLSRHLKQHAGVKYPCGHCDYKATQNSNLKRHLRTSHGIF